jgi:hypothetical protein
MAQGANRLKASKKKKKSRPKPYAKDGRNRKGAPMRKTKSLKKQNLAGRMDLVCSLGLSSLPALSFLVQTFA